MLYRMLEAKMCFEKRFTHFWLPKTSLQYCVYAGIDGFDQSVMRFYSVAVNNVHIESCGCVYTVPLSKEWTCSVCLSWKVVTCTTKHCFLSALNSNLKREFGYQCNCVMWFVFFWYSKNKEYLILCNEVFLIYNPSMSKHQGCTIMNAMPLGKVIVRSKQV